MIVKPILHSSLIVPVSMFTMFRRLLEMDKLTNLIPLTKLSVPVGGGEETQSFIMLSSQLSPQDKELKWPEVEDGVRAEF